MLLSFKASARLDENNTTVTCKARQHTIKLEDLTCFNKEESVAMNPVEGILSALGACQLILARLYATQYNINLIAIRAELEGELPEGACINARKKPHVDAIKAKFYVKTDSPKEEVEKFIKYIENSCPVAHLVKDSVQVFPDVIIDPA